MHDTKYSLPADRYRRQVYEALGARNAPLGERLASALDITRDYLGVANGHVARVDAAAGEQVIETSTDHGPDAAVPEGMVSDLATTYCRRTVERNSPLALSDAPAEGWADDPAYREHGLDCYLGVELRVGGETYGTLCFVDPDPRESFTETEVAFVETLARAVERELEADRYESRLDERRAQLDDRERRIERSETKYESLVETAPDAILLVDADTRAVVEANAAAAELTGYPEDELVGMSVLDIHVDRHRDTYREAFRELTAVERQRARLPDGTPLLVERADGSEVPVEINATVVELDGRQYVQGVFRDITERRERERELRVKDRALEAADIGVTIADARAEDTPILYANPEFERLTGHDADEAVGRNCRFLQGERTDDAAVAAVRRAVEAGEPVERELLNYRDDGTPFWNKLTVTPVHDGDEVTHFVGFQQDVTERRRRERLLRVLNRVLRHNLRNDMTVVRGHAESLAREHEGSVGDAAATIAETAAELSELSERARVLERAARASGSPRAVRAERFTEVAAERVREVAPDADLTVETATVPPVVGFDRLDRAFEELAENAARHAGPEPTVEVSVERVDGDRVAVRIADDGPGISEMERAPIDDRAETPLRHGTGLGLWLANWLVTDAGGSLDVEVGGGTTVTATLRVAPEDGTGPSAARYTRSAIGTD